MTASLPEELHVGLKEWATVCQATGAGRQILLLRKGGIYESAGEFEVENRQFLFFPTYLHQNLKMLKSDAQQGFEPHNAEPEKITLALAGEVTDIVQLQSREQMDRIEGEHVWTSPLIDMRFNYRPENPLYLLLIRGYTLAKAVTVENTPAYAGCKSWVPLEVGVSTMNAAAVLSDYEYARRRGELLERLHKCH